MSIVVVLGTAHPHVFGLAQSAAKMPGVKVAGVYDDDPQRREAAAQRLGIPVLGSIEQALATGPALALIGAVPSHRASLAAQSVRAGAAVLVDKPLAITEGDLKLVRQAVERHARPVIVYYPYRGHPYVLAARKAMKEGRIGRTVRVMSVGPHKLNAATRPDWHWTRKDNGGILLDIGSHHFDLVCWLAGQAPQTISAMHGNFSQPDHPEFQDFGQGQLRFPDGVMGHVEVDWLNPPPMKHFGDTRVWIQGTQGKIELRMGEQTEARIWTSTQPVADLDVASQPTGEHWDEQIMSDLIEGRPCPIPQEDVWLASQVTLRAFESAMQGGKPLTL